ncbi:MAG: hypothetical protein ACPGYG_03975, partial [Candidatus Puniceispirillaceae bacterium]
SWISWRPEKLNPGCFIVKPAFEIAPQSVFLTWKEFFSFRFSVDFREVFRGFLYLFSLFFSRSRECDLEFTK